MTDIACQFTVRHHNLGNGVIKEMADIHKYNLENISVGEIWASLSKYSPQIINP